MGSQKYIARLDLNHLVFYKNWKSEFTMSADYYNTEKIDFNLPIRVFLTDRVFLYEIYSSKKDKANENDLYVEAEGGRKRPKKCIQQKNRIEFPLTGPVGDLVVKGAFKVIIHQDDTDDDDPEFDDLLHAYTQGEIVSQSDVVFLANPSRTLWNEREGLFNCIMLLSAGKLTLSCVFFNVSRSVTVVGVKWLHDATTEITGGLFLSSFEDHKSALFETPKGKAIKVKHGQLIPLLRSTFAVIDGSTFKFDANVVSSGSLSVINDSITFKNDDFSEENNFTNSRVIGGKIQVEVTMKPN